MKILNYVIGDFMYTILLKEEDMIKENHFPIIAHINEAYNNDLLEFIEYMIKGIGVGYDYTCSSFWDELDDYDKENTEKYDGLMIETEDDEKVILSMAELLYYLELTQERLSDIDQAVTKNLKVYIDKFKTTYKGVL